MKAQGDSPHFSSGRATTAASNTAGCLHRAFSTAMDEMFSPPEMMMSLSRSLIFEVAVRVLDGQVAGLEPAVGEGGFRRFGIFEVAAHDGVAA